jgi:hypothetical protein
MKRKEALFFGIALAVSAAMFTLASCDNEIIPEDPPIPKSVTDDDSWTAAINDIKLNGAGKHYEITLTGDIEVAGSTGDTFGSTSGLTVTIKGSGKLALASGGNGAHLLQIKTGQTVNLGVPGGSGPTFQGKTGNNTNLVKVHEGGRLNMFSGTITGNKGTATDGAGGVAIRSGAVFTMKGGTISDNEAKYGGGVHMYVGDKTPLAVFTMEGGTISGNKVTGDGANGGGVSLDAKCTFTMKGGSITGNSVQADEVSGGGGVFINGTNCTFTLEGGSITGNSVQATTRGSAGGVFTGGGAVFTMSGGTISGNTATASGGGVMVVGSTTLFNKTGGTIYGDNDGTQNGNDNTVIGKTGYGHAVYFWNETTAYKREATLGPSDNISSGNTAPGSGWVQ